MLRWSGLVADPELDGAGLVDLRVEHFVVEGDRGGGVEEDPGAPGLEHLVARLRALDRL